MLCLTIATQLHLSTEAWSCLVEQIRFSRKVRHDQASVHNLTFRRRLIYCPKIKFRLNVPLRSLIKRGPGSELTVARNNVRLIIVSTVPMQILLVCPGHL